MKAFMQDLRMLRAYYMHKRMQFLSFFRRVRFGAAAGKDEPTHDFVLSEDDFIPTELEPYTDADLFRSVYEMIDDAQRDLGERMVSTTQLMMRTAAPLINTLVRPPHTSSPDLSIAP